MKEESQLVTFLLKDEEFGFDIMSVQEIIRLPKMARVPRTPPFVDGIANLRGVVLPIVDMRTRFGMERAEETDRTRVLVIDIGGVKTGLRVDRVKQVTRVLSSDIEPPPPAIRGTTADYLEGVVKLDKGQRIIMALNARQVCQIEAGRRGEVAAHEAERQQTSTGADSRDDVQQMVTFRIAKEEFAFPMESVREILRVETPKQVPDVPEYVLGVLTVRGRILPIVDLRRLLRQRSLGEELAGACRNLREEWERSLEQWRNAVGSHAQARAGTGVTERVRAWIGETNSSSQALMEALSKLRGLNEKTAKQLQNGAAKEDVAATAGSVVEALRYFETQVEASIQEDQRIVVVDAGGFILGLVVDHVNEVLNISRKLMEPPPQIASSGLELSGIAKLNNGGRLIMVLDIANLVRDRKLREFHQNSAQGSQIAESATAENKAESGRELSEMQLVTFLLGGEEYGVPISQIQEIDRLSKITKVPKAARFIEGVTNLRGEVIPVLDTRKRFELDGKASDDRTRIIIVELAGVKTGLIVDSVREVLSLSRKDIAAPPEAIHATGSQRFISGIGKVDAGKRMIVLLDVEKILSRDEQTKLAEAESD